MIENAPGWKLVAAALAVNRTHLGRLKAQALAGPDFPAAALLRDAEALVAQAQELLEKGPDRTPPKYSTLEDVSRACGIDPAEWKKEGP